MPPLARILKIAAKASLRSLFEQGQRLGVDILPRHFYSEIPDLRALRRSSYWKQPFSMIGVAGAEIERQLAVVAQICNNVVVQELRTARVWETAVKRNGEEGYGPAEADFLYAFIVTRRPAQIFQIGCGVSTAVCLQAAERTGYTPEIICIEPYPTRFLQEESERGHIRLLKEKVEALDYSEVEALGSDLLFFVDSTHTLGPAGEVSRIILEMLPRLKAGAMVHFHDIKFPYDYPRRILDGELFFPHESILLHAFLAYNHRFELAASLSMLNYAAPELLQEHLPGFRPAVNDEGLQVGDGHFPSATYLEVIG
jgi:predicted O-methyltransferase YrrM